MPAFSHIGISIGAPPMPKVAPTAPAKKPPITIYFIVKYSREISCTLSDAFIDNYFYDSKLLIYTVVLVLVCGISLIYIVFIALISFVFFKRVTNIHKTVIHIPTYIIKIANAAKLH